MLAVLLRTVLLFLGPAFFLMIFHSPVFDAFGVEAQLALIGFSALSKRPYWPSATVFEIPPGMSFFL